MSVTSLQFTTLFYGAFGCQLEDVGLELDISGDNPVARKGESEVTLLTVEDRGISWHVDGHPIAPFELPTRDDAGAQRKARNRQALTQAIG